ncbi:MAG TPA: hypothetical protein EYN06_05390, partial [Myxococcales bacterium]|nr:hypothetical protein [Myxococcales bacterium]
MSTLFMEFRRRTMRQAAYWAILVLLYSGCSESTTENPPLDDADVSNNMDVSDTTVATPDLIQNDESSSELPPQEDTLECADGFVPQDSECVDVDECAATESPCDKNASCSNSEGSFECECKTGYDGDGTTCSPILLGALSISTVDVAIKGSCLALTLIMTLDDTDDTESLWPVELTLDGGGLFSDAQCTEVASNPIEMAAKQEPGVVFVRFDQSGTKTLAASHLTLEDDSTELTIHGSSYADDTRPERTLVLYNKNADDALEIATYYAEKRGIPEKHLCGVLLPRGNFAFPQEMLGARKTIVEECFCTILSDNAPAECGVGSLTEILAVLNLTHIAVIRGIPARLYGTPWPQDNWDPGFDFNLSYLLANNEDIFADGTDGNLKIDFPYAGNQLCNNTLETLKPSEHRYFAISRIEAITATRTKALIDQTLAAEGQGFQGNIVSELPAGLAPANNVGQYVTSTFNSECLSYLSHTPFKHGEAESSWPFEVCRFGTTGSTSDAPWPGMMPGFNPTTIPLAVNVGWFDGSDPRTQVGEPQNNHSAFYNYNTMLKWRKSGENCPTECDDFNDPAEESACRENSTDYFKEINSECVGVAPGFMGQQLRSYPVQYYGFLPPGWFGGPSGAFETTPAHIIQGGAFKNDTFSDDLFARFGGGSPGIVNNDLCVDDSGANVSCPERVSVGIARKITLKSPIAVNADKTLTLRVRYRNQGATGAKLQVRIWLNNENSDLKDMEN